MTEGPTPRPSPGDFAASRPVPSPQAAVPQQPVPQQPDAGPDDTLHAATSGGTGDDRVDAAMRRLDAVEDLPVSEHVAQYDALHRTLQDALAAIDEG